MRSAVFGARTRGRPANCGWLSEAIPDCQRSS
jgi:hypothetical protein